MKDSILKIQQRIEDRFNRIRSKLNTKQKNMLLFLPRAVILMVFTVYFSNYIQSRLDLYWFIIGITVLSLFLFVIPLGVFFKNNKKSS